MLKCMQPNSHSDPLTLTNTKYVHYTTESQKSACLLWITFTLALNIYTFYQTLLHALYTKAALHQLYSPTTLMLLLSSSSACDPSS